MLNWPQQNLAVHYARIFCYLLNNKFNICPWRMAMPASAHAQEAGAWLQALFNYTAAGSRRDREVAWQRTAETSPLLEVGLWLRHKTRRVRKKPLEQRLRCLETQAFRFKFGRAIESLRSLMDSGVL